MNNVMVEERNKGFLPLYVSLAIFVITAAAYGGLLVVNRAQYETRLQLIDEIKLKQEDLQPRVLDQIFSFDQRLEQIEAVLKGHTIPSNLFVFLERNTHPRVQFTNLNLGEGDRITMAGQAESYAVLARQIAFFESDPDVRRLEFGGLSRGENKRVSFSISLAFVPSFLKRR